MDFNKIFVKTSYVRRTYRRILNYQLSLKFPEYLPNYESFVRMYRHGSSRPTFKEVIAFPSHIKNVNNVDL